MIFSNLIINDSKKELRFIFLSSYLVIKKLKSMMLPNCASMTTETVAWFLGAVRSKLVAEILKI